MIVEETVYLEHYGVKGMRWGVRRSGPNSDDPQKSNRKRNLALGAGVVAGSAMTAYIIKRNSGVKVSSVSNKNTTKVGSDIAKKILEQRREFATITTKMNNTNNLADAQLKDWYNKFNVPVPERIYSGRG